MIVRITIGRSFMRNVDDGGIEISPNTQTWNCHFHNKNLSKTNKQINSYLNSTVWFAIDFKNDRHQNHIANHHDKNTHCYSFEKNGPDGIRPEFDTEISSH